MRSFDTRAWSPIAVALAAAAIVCTSPAYAALGAAPTWQAAGTSNTQMTQRINAAAVLFRVNETTLPSGTVVREYVGTNGTVFAIAWQGPQMAPLNTLLGTYFPAYVQGLATAHTAQHNGYGPATVQQSNLVVQTGGHMGAFTGRAWLPLAVPAGFNTDDIQ
ncbi:DUF2844 domain-containing protein [Paraburkholderia kururiensis]|uniref:DUF2844 domain-containing protein n=1 Tax=Paraburkholderia kururiensis TaxID=984307 RepID=A0ABZ0WKZ2_9BURK|nr:DUF2844 domain-containing protein [Paraburkholderia kururiensis]WQD78019.1 DUF2844 domain-containing protein [Paraburkholderia kururiensis]